MSSRITSTTWYQDNKTTKKTVYTCPVPGCHYTTSFTKNNLRAHIFTHMPEKERPYQCTHEGCSRGFAQKPQLDKHLHLHSKRPLAAARPGNRVGKVVQLKEGEGEKYIKALMPHRRAIGK